MKLADLAVVKSTGLLPVFAYALLAVGLLAGLGGAWAGWKAKSLTYVAAENAGLRKDIRDLQAAAETLRKGTVETATRYSQAADRMAGMANTWEKQREENRLYTEQQRQALSDLLDARPDLRSSRAGDGVLRHWKASNAGASAGAAAPAAAGKPAPGLPGPAAAGGRQVGDAARKPRRRRGAVPRLQGRQGEAGRRGAGMGGDGVAVVLRGCRACGDRGGWLWA